LLNVKYSNPWLVAKYNCSNHLLVGKDIGKVTYGQLLKPLAMALTTTKHKGCKRVLATDRKLLKSPLATNSR
jgi:hypothetical protein